MKKSEEDIIVNIKHINYIKFISIDTMRALNRMRVGEEEEVANLVDFLSETTTRE